jgi:DNA-binding MarR family transcriptional regulator
MALLDDAAPAKRSLRLWLRLLTCAGTIERRVSAELRRQFGESLPRFDFLSALERNPRGLSLGEVSRRLLVTNGAVTGLAARLERDGLIERFEGSGDRRAQYVRLTPLGRRRFRAMAAAHEGWIEGLLGGLSEREASELMRLLDRTKGVLTRGSQ